MRSGPVCAVRAALLLVVSLLPLGAAACGGGGGTGSGGTGGGGGGGGGGVDPATLLTQKASFDAADVRHFLQRTHLAVRAADVATIAQIGLPGYVAQMLQLPQSPSAVETAADALLVNATDPANLQGGFPTQGQLAQWWLYLMQRTTTPFQEVVAMFWHDHFAASDANLEISETYWTKAHVNLWRRQGAGNLKDLVVAMARDWLMLLWLDGIQNTAAFPNENFAREVLELFTLGVDNGYTQADIVEGARGWTGYRERNVVVMGQPTGQREVVFDPTRHDAGQKTVFGTVIPAQNAHDDYQEMVDAIFANRPVEDFIARKILQAFCYASPPASVVTALGAQLRASGWSLASVFTTLFLSEAFYSPTAKAGFVKSPVEHALGFIRATGVLSPERTVLVGGLGALGHLPTQPPTVNGWPVDAEWLSAQGMVDRANLVNNVLAQRTFQQNNGINLASLLPPLPATTTQVVDQLATTLNLAITAAERAQYVAYLDTNASGQPSPFDPANATHVDQRLRGLLYVMTQHPLYPVR